MLSELILKAMQDIEKKYISGDDRWSALKAHLLSCARCSGVAEETLQAIYNGPPADIVNFSKSPEMAKWICNTVDAAGEALRSS